MLFEDGTELELRRRSRRGGNPEVTIGRRRHKMPYQVYNLLLRTCRRDDGDGYHPSERASERSFPLLNHFLQRRRR